MSDSPPTPTVPEPGRRGWGVSLALGAIVLATYLANGRVIGYATTRSPSGSRRSGSSGATGSTLEQIWPLG